MKRLILFAMLPFAAFAKTCVYDVTMHLRVPAIVDNMQSLGRRVYKTQLLKGQMTVKDTDREPDVTFTTLENRSHKVGLRYVSYDVGVDKVGWHAVGDNRTGVFRKASVFLSVEATPSYALADGEDNTLILTLAGCGATDRAISGYATGQLGCGCYAYGHVSPTRIYGTCTVVDTAAVWGTWRARKVKEYRHAKK